MRNSYYQKHQGEFRKEARKICQNLPEEKKEKDEKSPEKDIKIIL